MSNLRTKVYYKLYEHYRNYGKDIYIDIINEKYNKLYNPHYYKNNETNTPINRNNNSCNCIENRLALNYSTHNRYNSFVEIRPIATNIQIVNPNIEDIIRNYPSIHKQYIDEYSFLVEEFKKHQNYFHNNVYEELMKYVWHPKNIDKFHHWDPEFEL
jgi:hypothetical protein